MKRTQFAVVFLSVGALLLPAFVFAQGAASYPEKPVRIISALSTGGAVDTVGRIVAAKLSENMRRQFIIENRLGGGGTIGYAYVAKAPPDGYTLLVAGSGYTIAPALYSIPFDPLKDIKAQIMAVRAGFKSRAEVVSEQGYDAEAIDREIAGDNKRADSLGLEYDSDPRKEPNAASTASGDTNL